MGRNLRALCLALLAATHAAQAQETRADCPAPTNLDDGWTMATPKDAGFDPDKLCPLDKFISKWTGATVHGVVVVRHGKLVMERYYKGSDYRGDVIEFGPTVRHGLFSISNSVISLLIGLAQGQCKCPDRDAPPLQPPPGN